VFVLSFGKQSFELMRKLLGNDLNFISEFLLFNYFTQKYL